MFVSPLLLWFWHFYDKDAQYSVALMVKAWECGRTVDDRAAGKVLLSPYAHGCATFDYEERYVNGSFMSLQMRFGLKFYVNDFAFRPAVEALFLPCPW